MRVGRIREKLAKLLIEAGYEVFPEQIQQQPGDYRKGDWDMPRWFVSTSERHLKYLYCYDRMSECVQNGIIIARRNNGDYEVCVKEKL